MMKWNGTMTALSLAGALLVMAPGLASATENLADGPGELLRVAAPGGGHSGGGHGGHEGRGERHRGGEDEIATFDDYVGDYHYGNGCGLYRHKWHETGQPYWLRRYEFCLRG